MIHGDLVRPFCASAGVYCRKYTELFQRFITDFGADVPFGKINNKMMEHHLVAVPPDSARLTTLKHAKNIQLMPPIVGKKKEDCIVAEIDGAMIPIVDVPKKIDKEADLRKQRTVRYAEGRLALAYAKGSVTPVFRATLGSTDEAGLALKACVRRIGFGVKTFIHCGGETFWDPRKIYS